MPIRDYEDFESVMMLVRNNCGAAIEAYCCAFALSHSYHKKVVPNIAFDLMWFTIQSGLLSLCRVWDRNALSIKDLLLLLEADFVRAVIDRNILSEDFFDVLTKLEYEYNHIAASTELAKIRNYRNNFLAHSSGADPNKDNPMFGDDYRKLLENTITIIDQLAHMFGRENNTLQEKYVMRLHESRQVKIIVHEPEREVGF